tara:strand:+ start:4053 stop:4565 length:513 start_codon:yes stop_codon:yes gene_type:complete
MEKKAKSRLTIKHNNVQFKDDDYETPSECLTDLLPFLEPNKIIYDPFYCNGRVINEWNELGYECINEKKDAFNREHPTDFDYLISNIPFSCKEKCIELGITLDTPFCLLMPIDAMGSKWIGKYFDYLQFIIPNGRYNFLKNGNKGAGAWFDTMWVCYKMNLPETIIKLST